jgi:RND family efflux transporter MFP subunit
MEEERKTELRAVTSFVIALALLGGAVFGFILLVTNARKAKQQEIPRAVPAVAVHLVEQGDHAVEIRSQGVVESRRETKLAAEVGGLVLSVSPNLKRGGAVAEGEVLVTLDPADYKAALARAEAALADARLALVQEEARAEQALRDWEKLGRGEATPLVRREPQLASARARVASADAEVLRAARDVQRTEIRAPFAARVRQAAVETGAVIAPGGMVADLYSADDLEVRLPLSLEDFGFLDPRSRPAVQLRGRIGGEDFLWPAEVARIDGEVDRKTLSAYVTVKVLAAAGARPLPPVGLFVHATAEGRTLAGVSRIPRTALLGGDRVITVTAENRLDFRDVEVLRTTEDSALVSGGIRPGDRLSITRLNAPVAGMEVRVEEKQPAAE